MALSRPQGMLVAPRTRIPSMSWPTPCIWKGRRKEEEEEEEEE